MAASMDQVPTATASERSLLEPAREMGSSRDGGGGRGKGGGDSK